MPANIRPSELSRDSVHVELRDNTSIWLDCSAAQRGGAAAAGAGGGGRRTEGARNVTLAGSPKIAAATARQMSTSKPVHAFLSSVLEKPSNPWLTPQLSVPRSLTAFRVWAPAGRPARTKASNARIGKITVRFSKSGIWISRSVAASAFLSGKDVRRLTQPQRLPMHS